MRLKYALKNSVFGVVSQIILIICGVVLQRVMVQTLGDANIGMNAVFSNIISIMSLSEMGVASAIVYNLYEPLAKKNTEMIRSLMLLFKKAYRVIALAVTALGLILTPFVHIFIKNEALSDLTYVRIVFLLFVTKTSLSYLYSYKRSLLTADQKSYVLIGADLAARLISMGLSFAVLIWTKSIIWYLVVNIIITFAENVVVAGIVDKMYPYAKDKGNPLDKAVSKKVFKDVKNIFVGKLSGTILSSTDYIIISSFVNVIEAGWYSNYNMITNSVYVIISKIQYGIQSSIGDMFVEKNNTKNYKVLRQLTFLFFWISVVAAVCIFSVIDVFVADIWLSPDKTLPLQTVAITVVIFFMLGVRAPLWSMLSVSGLFEYDKYISLLGAASNIVISLICVQYWGMFGVFVGTIISQGLQFVLKIILFFKRYLELPAKRFWVDMLEYYLILFAAGAASYTLCTMITIPNDYLRIIVQFALAFALPNALIFVCFIRDERMKFVFNLIKYYAKKKGA